MAEEIKDTREETKEKYEIPFDQQWSGGSYYSHAQGRRVYLTYGDLRRIGEANQAQTQMHMRQQGYNGWDKRR